MFKLTFHNVISLQNHGETFFIVHCFSLSAKIQQLDIGLIREKYFLSNFFNLIPFDHKRLAKGSLYKICRRKLFPLFQDFKRWDAQRLPAKKVRKTGRISNYKYSFKLRAVEC